MPTTKIKVEFFKSSGKFYTSFSCTTPVRIHETTELRTICVQYPQFVYGMDFTMEVEDESISAWNKYLYGAVERPVSSERNAYSITEK